MPLRNITKNTTLGFWKITETAEELLQNYTPTPLEMDFFNRFAPQKKLHFLASRVLLNTMLPNAKLNKDEFGKPQIVNSQIKMSWSHSGSYAALTLCSNAETGVDIELISDRITRIQQKFINTTDAKSLAQGYSNLKELLVIWGAKESMYKFYGKKQLDFKKHMSVLPFMIKDNDQFLGKIHHPNFNCNLQLGYDFFDNHLAVWIEKPL